MLANRIFSIITTSFYKLQHLFMNYYRKQSYFKDSQGWIQNIRVVFCTCVQCLIMFSTNDASNLTVCPVYQFKTISAVHDIQIGIGYHPTFQLPVHWFPVISYRTKRHECESDWSCSSCAGFKIAQNLTSFRSVCFNAVMFKQRKAVWKYEVKQREALWKWKVSVLKFTSSKCTNLLGLYLIWIA